jgi:hypothetical protein
MISCGNLLVEAVILYNAVNSVYNRRTIEFKMISGAIPASLSTLHTFERRHHAPIMLGLPLAVLGKALGRFFHL